MRLSNIGCCCLLSLLAGCAIEGVGWQGHVDAYNNAAADGREYPMRPSACRGFQSTNVNRCKDAFDDPYDDRPHTPDPVREFVKAQYVGDIYTSQRRQGCDAAGYEMHGAVAAALADAQFIARWRAGEVTFPAVADRTPVPWGLG